MDIREFTAEGERGARHPWELSRRWFAHALVRSVCRRGERPIRRILDMGCGDAFISRHLAECYPRVRVDAVDTALSPAILQRLPTLAEVSNLHLATSVEGLPPSEDSVGITLLLDVLEHVPDDLSFLRSLVDSPLMDPSAFFLITVPAFGMLYCSHDRLVGHYRRYTLAGLRHLAEGAGLQILEGGYCFLSGLWLRAIHTILERVGLARPLKQTQLSSWRGGPTINGLLRNFLKLDLVVSRVLARSHLRFPGLSCYLISRKLG